MIGMHDMMIIETDQLDQLDCERSQITVTSIHSLMKY
jgi:hypothetical protein